MNASYKTLYEVAIRYTEFTDRRRRKTDVYVVYADSFSDAEAKSIEYFSAIHDSDFIVTKIKRAKFAGLIRKRDDDGKGSYYQCTLTYDVADDEAMKEVRIKERYLVFAPDTDNIGERMKETEKLDAGSEIDGINATKIIDIID